MTNPHSHSSISNAAERDRFCLARQGDQWWAIPAETVREVASTPAVSSLCASLPALAGICHYRNEFLAVVSARTIAGNGGGAEGGFGTQMIVIDGAEAAWALCVDEVVGLERLDVCVQPEGRAGDDRLDGCWATATHGDQIVWVIDPKRLYRAVERELQSQWDTRLPTATTSPANSSVTTAIDGVLADTTGGQA